MRVRRREVSTTCGSGWVVITLACKNLSLEASHIIKARHRVAQMWNDTDLPLAYLITFRCHGTWLHGDDRGSTDRRHNIYRTPHIPANERWQQHNTKALKSEAQTLDAQQRQSIENAIRETCLYRRW